MRLLAMAAPLGSQTLGIEAALGRFLANDMVARRTRPPADLSAMDGYAVRHDELVGPWQVMGESAAGYPYAGDLNAGEAVRISTGALMPVGSGAILLQENASRDGNTLSLSGDDPAKPRHIRRKGLDFCTGDTLIAKGAVIGPAQIALALSGGRAALEVGQQPSIAILDNGDELSADVENAADHQIPASNGAMLLAIARPLVRQCNRIGPVPDNMDAMLAALGKAGDADVLVTSGGASVGDHDLVRPALERWGADIAFWRIAMKPGKPLLVARRGKQIVLGLPGNPVSSYVTALLFMLPLLKQLAGATQPLPQAIVLPLAAPMPANGARATFVRARFVDGGIAPLNQQDSSALAALAMADGLIARPINAASADIGEMASVFIL